MKTYGGLTLATIGLVVVLLIVVRGSRPHRGSTAYHAHRWRYLSHYTPVGLVVALAPALPFGWAVGDLASGEIGNMHDATKVHALAAAFVLALLAWKWAKSLEIVVGVASCVAQLLFRGALGETSATSIVATCILALLIGTSAFLFKSLRLRRLPLAVAAYLDIATLWVNVGFADGRLLPPFGIVAGAVAVLILLSLAPRLVFAMLGIALTFANLATYQVIGTSESRKALVFGLWGVLGAGCAALITDPDS